MEILKCRGVRKVYGAGGNQVTALDGIDLSVNKGEFVAIVGASGSGKSTLLHILGSVDKPTEGSVIIDGTELSELNPTRAAIFRRRKVGLVYQFYNLIPTLTVRKNILMPLAPGGAAKPAVRRPAAEGGHCPQPNLPSRAASGGRAHWESGSEEFPGNHGYAQAFQPQPGADHSADYPRREGGPGGGTRYHCPGRAYHKR